MSVKQDRVNSLLLQLNETRDAYDTFPSSSHQARQCGSKMLRLLIKLNHQQHAVFEFYGEYVFESMLDEKIRVFRAHAQSNLDKLRRVSAQYSQTYRPNTVDEAMLRFRLSKERDALIQFFMIHTIGIHEEYPHHWIFVHFDSDLERAIIRVTTLTLFQARHICKEE